MSDLGGLTDDESSPEEASALPTKLQLPPQSIPTTKSQPATTNVPINGPEVANANPNANSIKRKGISQTRTAVGQSVTILPAEKVFPIQVGTELFRLSGASISSDGPSYFTQFFEEQIRQNEDSGGVRTLYIDRDPVTFRDIARHLQGYYIIPSDGTHFVRLFADAQFYSLPRLITQLFDSEIFIQIGEEHFQIPKDLFSDPGNSPNFFSLGFAVFFSTPGDVFPGLDKRGLLRPPPINPPHVPSRASSVFSQLLHMLRGYPLEIKDEIHRTQLLRDCRYFHLRGLEQKIIAHEISYNLERKRSEICLRIEDIKPSGISYQAESRENAAQTAQSSIGGGWVYYSRPFVDEAPYELIIEIGKESTEVDLNAMRAKFHGAAKARVTSLFKVIANKMNLPANAPLGLIMLSGTSPSPVSSPGFSALSDDMIKIHFDSASAITLDGEAYVSNQLAEPMHATIGDNSEDMDITNHDHNNQKQVSLTKGNHKSGKKPISSNNTGSRNHAVSDTVISELPPPKKRKLDENAQNHEQWIVQTGQWRLRIQPTQDPARSGYEIIFVAVKIDAFSSERARNARRGFLTS